MKIYVIYSAVFLIGVLVLYFFDPNQHNFFITCQFKQLTNFDCPSCGMQRAGHALLNGNIVSAWQLNPLIFVLGSYSIAGLFYPALKKLNSNAIITSVFSRKAAIVVVVVAFLYGIIRNL